MRNSEFLALVLGLCLKQTFAVSFIGTPETYEASPAIEFRIGEGAINSFLSKAKQNSVSFVAKDHLDATGDVLLGEAPYEMYASITKLELDFEEGSASFSLGLRITYNLGASPQTVDIPYSASLRVADLGYDIGSTRIRMAINETDRWYDYLTAHFSNLPQYVVDLLITDAAEMYVANRDWLLGQLEPEFRLPDAPVFWQDPELTLGFSFDDDFMTILMVPHIESEKPHIELWAKKGTSNSRAIRYMLVANAKYSIKDLRILDLQGRVDEGPINTEMNRLGSGRHERYYASFSIPFHNHWSWSAVQYVRAHFCNNKQLVTMLWQGNKSGYSQHEWRLYGLFGTPVEPATTD